MEIKKKIQAVRLLKKLEGTDSPEMSVIDGLLNEISTLQMMIPDSIDISPIKRNIEEIRQQYASLSATLAAFDVEISNVRNTILERDTQSLETSLEIEKNFTYFDEKLAELRRDLLSKITNRGGGNANRNIVVDSTTVLSPYTDINFKSGANITISTATNNTTKQTDITFTGAATGSTLTAETPTGTVDGNNVTFTVTHTPVQLFTDNMYRISGTDYTYAAGTITMNALLAPTNSIVSYYNA